MAEPSAEAASSYPNIRIINVKGRSYRRAEIPPPSTANRTSSTTGTQEGKGALQQEDRVSDHHNLALKYDENSKRFTFQADVSPVFYGSIIGKGREKLLELQRSTGCKVALPDRKSQSTLVQFSGPTEESVVRAHSRVESIIEDATTYLPYTHFISIPLNSEQMQKKFDQFKKDGAAACEGATGFEPALFIKSAQLHMTCFLVKLFSQDDINTAAKLMKEWAPRIYDAIGTTSLLLNVRGLEIMNDDSSAVDVCYLKVANDEGMQKVRKICKLLIEAFVKAKLLPLYEVTKQMLFDNATYDHLRRSLKGDKGGESEPSAQADTKEGESKSEGASSVNNLGVTIKFHVTALNTKFRPASLEERKQAEADHAKKGPRGEPIVPRRKFDATKLMKQFGNLDFGTERIPEIHLSDRSGFDAKTGYYLSTAVIKLP